MKTNALFNPQRMWWVLKRDFLTSLRPALIVFGGFFGVLLIINTLMVWSMDANDMDENFHLVFYALTMYGGGAILTSRAFGELHRPLSRISFLNLPASTFEKLLSMFLLTAVGYGLLIWLVYPLYVLIVNGFTDAIFGRYMSPISWTDTWVLFHLRLYLVVNSVFLLGAAIFNRFVLPKTLISILVIEILLFALGMLILRIVFIDVEDLFNSRPPQPSKSFINFAENTLWSWAQQFFWWLVAPFFWVVTYFKLKEREV